MGRGGDGGGLASGCPLCQSFPAPLGRHPFLRPAPCQATAHFLPPGLQGRLPRGETKVRASPCRFPGKPRLSPGLPGHARGCAGPRQRWGRGIFPLTVWQASAACDEAQPTQQWPPLIPLIPQPPGSGRPPPPPVRCVFLAGLRCPPLLGRRQWVAQVRLESHSQDGGRCGGGKLRRRLG